MALKYRLHEHNFTIYHRAALGGLAATIKAWKETSMPEGIAATVKPDAVEISWSNALTEQEALRRILTGSFKLTEEMINLPGQFVGADRVDLRLAIHNGICLTFLQHPKMRPGPKEARKIELKNADQEVGHILTYKAINSYAHQKAQGTGLLDEPKKKSKGVAGQFPEIATIPQSVVPGAMTGQKALQAKPDEAILLLFLIVGCPIFLLRPRTYQEKAQACIVVPDVVDLEKFATDMKRLAFIKQEMQVFSNTYLGRIVGGAEEAALRFLIDIQAGAISGKRSVVGCQAIAMGKVAWDKNQINRSISVKLRGEYPEIDVFRAAYSNLGQAKLVKTKKGESFAIPATTVPELVAANLAADRPWCAHFKDLVTKKKDFQRMQFARGGLNQMVKAIKDEVDLAVIQAFYDAWKRIRGQLWERADREKLGKEGYYRLLEVRSERIRNEILRIKTPALLANWFLRFCAEATKGKNLGAISQKSNQIREFIFNPRYFERFQNLLLFALVSYKSEEFEISTESGEN
ncbi:MAG TPA: type I-MYXAN CRISPR-associated Cas8a1/Cmx1 [Cyanobacteria bacterium UBA11372]|nr:type I-MYXAN CRISPR-associated Cas8a1/Cmx1 [Cyanobacteria bacterium UBA11372]